MRINDVAIAVADQEISVFCRSPGRHHSGTRARRGPIFNQRQILPVDCFPSLEAWNGADVSGDVVSGLVGQKINILLRFSHDGVPSDHCRKGIETARRVDLDQGLANFVDVRPGTLAQLLAYDKKQNREDYDVCRRDDCRNQPRKPKCRSPRKFSLGRQSGNPAL